MSDLVYLHGFGSINPEDTCTIYAQLRDYFPGGKIHCPHYHPRGDVQATRIDPVLDQCRAIANASESATVKLVGYSFGGLLAALFMERMPEMVEKVILLAPAIDNVDRNYKHVLKENWQMPVGFVERLRKFPARPSVKRPTLLFHGSLDTDDGGSAPWRIMEWIETDTFEQAHLLPGVDHSLEPWLSEEAWRADRPSVPSIQDAFAWLVETST